MMWVRWTLPRLRIDQVITTCLKYCVPIAAVAFLGRDVVAVRSCRTGMFFGMLHAARASRTSSRRLLGSAERGRPADAEPISGAAATMTAPPISGFEQTE